MTGVVVPFSHVTTQAALFMAGIVGATLVALGVGCFVTAYVLTQMGKRR